YVPRERWERLTDADLAELREHVAGLPSELDHGHITARLFDLTCLNLQIALVNATADFIGWRDRIIEIASNLEGKDTIPAVKAQLALIQELQTETFWQDITLQMIEDVRRRIRGLVQFVDKTSSTPVYTALDDEIGEGSEVTLTSFSAGINLAQYKRKVEAYIRSHDNHVAIAKLRHNRPLTPTDLEELERFVYGAEVVGGRATFEKHYGN